MKAHFFDNKINMHSAILSTAEVEEHKTAEVKVKVSIDGGGLDACTHTMGHTH